MAEIAGDKANLLLNVLRALMGVNIDIVVDIDGRGESFVVSQHLILLENWRVPHANYFWS